MDKNLYIKSATHCNHSEQRICAAYTHSVGPSNLTYTQRCAINRHISSSWHGLMRIFFDDAQSLLLLLLYSFDPRQIRPNTSQPISNDNKAEQPQQQQQREWTEYDGQRVFARRKIMDTF